MADASKTTSLSRLIAEALVLAGGVHPCAVLGHKWVFHGGRNCGCEDGDCLFPVHRHDDCGDFDYGDDAQAEEIKADCGRECA